MRWFLYLIPAIVVEIIAWFLTPLVCLFVVKRPRLDRVKRRANAEVLMVREYLPDWLDYFQTHDNAVDEYFWGHYSDKPTEAQYLTSLWWRYYCRCMWLFRNTAYGFHYNWFSVPLESETATVHGEKGNGFWYRYRSRQSSWQLQYQIPIPATRRYIDGNIGFKAHKGFPRMMIANRLIGLRSYKD